MKALLLSLLLVGLLAEGRSQLTCFQCDGCGDPFDTSANPQYPCPQDGLQTTLTPPPLPIETTTAGIDIPTPPGPELTEPPVFPPVIPPLRSKRQVVNAHRCFRIEMNGQIRRGCAMLINTNEQTCISVAGGIVPTTCQICDWNGCNSATGLKVSMATLLTVSVLMLAAKLF